MALPSISLSPGGSKFAKIIPEDGSGAPGLMGPNAPSWQSSDLTKVVISGIASDGSTATVTVLSTAPPGTSATVTVTGANNLSQIVQSAFVVNVQENPATPVEFVFS